MDAALVGVVVGAVLGGVLGGGSQILADSLRSRRERQRWIDDYKREAYRKHVDALEALYSSVKDLSIPGKFSTFKLALSRVEDSRNAIRFYGSEPVRKFSRMLERELMGTPHVELNDRRDEITHLISQLTTQMRYELGIRD